MKHYGSSGFEQNKTVQQISLAWTILSSSFSFSTLYCTLSYEVTCCMQTAALTNCDKWDSEWSEDFKTRWREMGITGQDDNRGFGDDKWIYWTYTGHDKKTKQTHNANIDTHTHTQKSHKNTVGQDKNKTRETKTLASWCLVLFCNCTTQIRGPCITVPFNRPLLETPPICWVFWDYFCCFDGPLR